jgi:hypothetical protein
MEWLESLETVGGSVKSGDNLFHFRSRRLTLDISLLRTMRFPSSLAPRSAQHRTCSSLWSNERSICFLERTERANHEEAQAQRQPCAAEGLLALGEKCCASLAKRAAWQWRQWTLPVEVAPRLGDGNGRTQHNFPVCSCFCGGCAHWPSQLVGDRHSGHSGQPWPPEPAVTTARPWRLSTPSKPTRHRFVCPVCVCRM